MKSNDRKAVDKCACLNIRMVARRVTRFYEDALSETDLTINQFPIIAILVEKDCSLSEISDELELDRTTVTRTIGRLEEKGMVFTGKGEDQRKRIVTLTDRGHEHYEEAFREWKKAQDQVVENVGTEEFQDLLEYLNQLMGAVPSE